MQFRRLPHRQVYFCPDGQTLLWTVSFGHWRPYQDAQLVPALRKVYESLTVAGEVSADDRPLAQFLLSQGVLELATEPAPARFPGWKKRAGVLLDRFQPALWDRTWRDAVYCFPGDGEGGCWRYHYQAGRTPCLGCLWRHWMMLSQPELVSRCEREWPDLELSWPAVPMPAAFRRTRLPAGAIDYWRNGRLWRGRVWARPGCGCCPPQRSTPQWWLWTHPVAGPLSRVVEEQAPESLWRVTVQLADVRGNGSKGSLRQARRAALGETLERWAAFHPPLQPGERVRVWRLGRFGTRQVHPGRVWLGVSSRRDRLSHGLACGSSLPRAVRAGFWELIERDGLARWWRSRAGILRHGKYLWSVAGAWGRVFVACQPAPAGGAAWGSAAGPQAAQRASQEARHNALVHLAHPPALPQECRTFSDHSARAWHVPIEDWRTLAELPLEPLPAEAPPWRQALLDLPMRFYYRELPCHWADVLGWSVVRVLSPDLLGLPMDHRHWPDGPPPAEPHPFG